MARGKSTDYRLSNGELLCNGSFLRGQAIGAKPAMAPKTFRANIDLH